MRQRYRALRQGADAIVKSKSRAPQVTCSVASLRCGPHRSDGLTQPATFQPRQHLMHEVRQVVGIVDENESGTIETYIAQSAEFFCDVIGRAEDRVVIARDHRAR